MKPLLLMVAAAGLVWWLLTPSSPKAPPSKVDAAKEAQFQKLVGTGGVIAGAMRNPASIVFEDVRSNDDASVMCFQYRAQNGFGGMNRDIAVMYKGVATQDVGTWNAVCRAIPRHDLALFQLNRH